MYLSSELLERNLMLNKNRKKLEKETFSVFRHSGGGNVKLVESLGTNNEE